MSRPSASSAADTSDAPARKAARRMASSFIVGPAEQKEGRGEEEGRVGPDSECRRKERTAMLQAAGRGRGERCRPGQRGNPKAGGRARVERAELTAVDEEERNETVADGRREGKAKRDWRERGWRSGARKEEGWPESKARGGDASSEERPPTGTQSRRRAWKERGKLRCLPGCRQDCRRARGSRAGKPSSDLLPATKS